MANDLTVTDFELDELKESINIGASHASDALSKLLNKKVFLSVPEVNISDFQSSVDFIGDGESDMTSIKVKVQGEKKGVMFYLFPDKTDCKLLKIISPNRPDSEELTEEDKSILSEIGNILSGSFLTAISQFLGVNFLHSVSKITSDKLNKVVKSAVSEIITDNDKILILKISLSIREENIRTNLFFLMDPGFTDSILESSKKMINNLK